MCFYLYDSRNEALVVLAVFILVGVLITAGVIYVLTNLIAYQNSSPNSEMVAENWAGYAVASDLQNPQPEVTSVNGSWTVPSVSDIGVDAFSAVWVGIGGQYGHSLIQVGTQQDWISGGAAYSAWYETLPDQSVTIDSMQVSAGDKIEASVTLVDSGSDVWSVAIADLSSAQSFQVNITYDPGRLSGEWIVERPDVNGATSTLADFGSVTFSGCQAVVGGNGSIAAFQNVRIIMQTSQGSSRSVQLADVSDLTDGGTGFTVSYLNS
jgi:Peptidase A4 family.